MALAASETGHLVLGTMNTPSCAKTIDRVVDLFPPGDQAQVRMTLAGGLHLVVGQRLVPAADGKGMVAAAELLPGSVALWSLIRDNKTFQIPSLQQRGKGFGILRLDDQLADLVRAGRATAAAALAVAENPDELEAVLAGKSSAPKAAEPPKKGDGLLGKAGQIFGKRGP
jgi:twitching motility protein PilT